MGIDLNNGEPRLAHNDGTDCGCMLVPDDGNDTDTDGGDATDGDNGGSGDAGNGGDAGAGGDPAPAGENGETTEEEKKPEEGTEDTGEGTEGGATVLLSAATAIAAMLAF